jgi:hypothetical protein
VLENGTMPGGLEIVEIAFSLFVKCPFPPKTHIADLSRYLA